ncbi:MAG: DUF5947 family protein [Solirubrobacteraceae bacterium MAG38_C4-C5]|nr:DUF5947 family protein [Candidatus Siliceabacter maunaloa]
MASRLAQLARANSAPTAEPEGDPADSVAEVEVCDLCGAPVPPLHRHLVDLQTRRMMCACQACKILFDSDAAGGGHLRLVPDRRRELTEFVLDDAGWAALQIPVDMAFFFFNTPAQRVIALYPSPAGPTESQLRLEAWAELEVANPVLDELTPDVEALLINRAGDKREHWLVPIDDCYQLTGLIRTHWSGLSGGDEVQQQIDGFFDQLRSRR